MNAFDTNLVVRILVDDDPKQRAKARAAAEAGGFISKTVVLETVWVLESVYGFKQGLILEALLKPAALPTIQIEDAAGLAQAVRLAQAGLGFEDAYHVMNARQSDVFLTFDRQLVKHAGKLGLRQTVKTP